jgi:hypothetical protein
VAAAVGELGVAVSDGDRGVDLRLEAVGHRG